MSSDLVDEHIYEELDYYYLDSKMINNSDNRNNHSDECTNKNNSSQPTNRRLFLGTRDEILDYLNVARQRIDINNDNDKLIVDDILLDYDVSDQKNLSLNAADSDDVVDLNVTNYIDNININSNDDSGNSSLCLGDDNYQDTLMCFMKKKSKSAAINGSNTNNSTGSINNSTPINRRNRVSNISNASSESSATSGVSVSNMAMDDTEDDGITTSSSSLGSMVNSSTSYYPTAKNNNNGCSTIERNDSGVGNELVPNTNAGSSAVLKSSLKNKNYETDGAVVDVDNVDVGDLLSSSTRQICMDCELHQSSKLSITKVNHRHQNYHRVSTPLTATNTNANASATKVTENAAAELYYSSLNYVLCSHCEKRRNERKEIITEIIDTEVKYGRDLRIILEEFAKPISVAGLLTQQQVDDIFLNLDELIEVNCHFAEQLEDAFYLAIEQDDEVKYIIFTVNMRQLNEINLV